MLQTLEKQAACQPQSKLKITSFLNNLPQNSQNAFFKACTHPLALDAIKSFIKKLESASAVACYDPFNNLPAFASLHNLTKVKISNVYVQQVPDINKEILNFTTLPIDQIKQERPETIAVFAFDAELQITNIRHLLPQNIEIITLDQIKIPSSYLTDTKNYLSPLNFATNFGFLRDAGGLHTNITIANYWGIYGAKDTSLCCWLFDENGQELANWQQSMGAAGAQTIIDSKEIRQRFALGEFTGSLFMHAIKVHGHDIVKYVCDIYDDAGEIHSVTHDSNSWPADFYAGILAPNPGEQVLLWIQNCYPFTIAPGNIGLRLMGGDNVTYLEEEIAPFATKSWDLGAALPAAFPAQYEIIANKYFTRPRFEVLGAKGMRYISHANVERTDLVPDKNLSHISQYLGKGYILPFPIMPTDKFDTIIVPTPMATSQQELSLYCYIYDTAGNLILEKTLPKSLRQTSTVINCRQLLQGQNFTGGHIELAYNPAEIANADGWLHAIARFTSTNTGQAAETSFGAHIYNIPLVYKNEPQSYKGAPPGLRTTLVLRCHGGEDSFCNLIYPTSKSWLPHSSTDLILHNEQGIKIATHQIKIPLNGSKLWSYKEIFTQQEREKAGYNSYIIIKDTTCRLFGFHGQTNSSGVFSLDHMFGF